MNLEEIKYYVHQLHYYEPLPKEVVELEIRTG